MGMKHYIYCVSLPSKLFLVLYFILRIFKIIMLSQFLVFVGYMPICFKGRFEGRFKCALKHDFYALQTNNTFVVLEPRP